VTLHVDRVYAWTHSYYSGTQGDLQVEMACTARSSCSRHIPPTATPGLPLPTCLRKGSGASLISGWRTLHMTIRIVL